MARYHVPYRGEPQRKYPKPRRQVRNLRRERWLDWLSMGIPLFATIALIVFGVVFHRDMEVIALGIIFSGAIFGLTVTASIHDAAKSINRFRRGYDIDISNSEEERQRRQAQGAERENG
ncbi:MAG: prepilin peptidase [Chloroflexi bacterium]|nr:prepilin peptidase [Chloroflexota bacterium]